MGCKGQATCLSSIVYQYTLSIELCDVPEALRSSALASAATPVLVNAPTLIARSTSINREVK